MFKVTFRVGYSGKSMIKIGLDVVLDVVLYVGVDRVVDLEIGVVYML